MAQQVDRKIKYRYDDFILKLRRTKMEYTVEAQAPDGTRKKRPFIALPTWSRDVTTFTRYFQQQAERAETGRIMEQIVATEEVPGDAVVGADVVRVPVERPRASDEPAGE